MGTKRGIRLAGLLMFGGLGLAGCNFDRGEAETRYDDVGELDLEHQGRVYARVHPAAQTGATNSSEEAIPSRGQRHAHEVGEMSLEETAGRSSRTERKAPPAPLKVEKSAPASDSQPAVVKVPAPAPTPEYRVQNAVVAAPAKQLPARAVRSASPQARGAHHSSNVGEIELGY